jgi:hypothetical protein
MQPGDPKPIKPTGDSALGGMEKAVDTGFHVLHTYDTFRKARDVFGAGVLSTVQAAYRWLHPVGPWMKGEAFSFWTAFVFTFPLTAAIAVSVLLWKFIGLDSTIRGGAKVFAWCLGFSVVLGVFTGVGEQFVHLRVGSDDAYAHTLQLLGANNTMDAQVHQFVSTLSGIRGFGSALAGLVESAYVYGLGNFIFSLIVGLLLGWLCAGVLGRLLNRVPA